MQDLASISENVKTQRGKKAEYSSFSCPEALAHLANLTLVTMKVNETEDKAQGCPKMGI